MDIETYVPKVRGLINRLDTVEDDHLHMAMGMVGEIGEVVDLVKKSFAYGRELDKQKLLEELGDFTFYAVGLADMLCVELTGEDGMAVESGDGKTNMILATLAFMSGATLAAHTYGPSAGSDADEREALKEAVLLVGCIARDLGSNLEEVLDLNIKKLSVRYPNLTFDADRANNRDVEAEREAMRS